MAKQVWKAGNMVYPLPAVMVSTADKEDGAGAEIAVRIPTNRKGLFVSYFSPVSFNLFRYSEGM